MINDKRVEFLVGVFILAGIVSLLVLAFRVSGLTQYVGRDVYHVTANFDNIGGLKIRAPVTIAGVRIGQVSNVGFDPKTFQAVVTLAIVKSQGNIPTDSSAAILTEGLLGSQYISLTPGFDESALKNGSHLQETHSALILENLIGQFLFNAGKKSDTDKKN